jgi:RNA polymerase sigma-70 factor, ECF subfamily
MMVAPGDDEARLSQLMLDAIGGNERAYATLLEALARLIRAVARRKLGDRPASDCEDIVQETLLAIHLKRHTWQRGAPLKPWVFAIARHKIVDSYRRRGRRIELDISEFAEILPEPVNETASTAEVGRALDGLPEGQRNVVRAIAVEGQSITEASAALGMKPVAVRVALHRGLGAIAARFGKTS